MRRKPIAVVACNGRRQLKNAGTLAWYAERAGV